MSWYSLVQAIWIVWFILLRWVKKICIWLPSKLLTAPSMICTIPVISWVSPTTIYPRLRQYEPWWQWCYDISMISSVNGGSMISILFQSLTLLQTLFLIPRIWAFIFSSSAFHSGSTSSLLMHSSCLMEPGSMIYISTWPFLAVSDLPWVCLTFLSHPVSNMFPYVHFGVLKLRLRLASDTIFYFLNPLLHSYSHFIKLTFPLAFHQVRTWLSSWNLVWSLQVWW